ncbi:DNA polymerase I [bacterium]|nr:DNA polymerase I [bacterium]
MDAFDIYREIWLVDFEFTARPGERPTPICMVARELRTGRLVRLGGNDLYASKLPFPIGDDVLFVAFYASAELGCFLALDWEMPKNVLDLFVEFRCLTNGRLLLNGSSLVGALLFYGLDMIDVSDKTKMRELAVRGGPFTDSESLALLDYCQRDVEALAILLPRMASEIDVPRALLRGRYMMAAAQMEWAGIPIDVETLARLQRNWERIKSQLIQRVDNGFGVYEGRRFKSDRFAAWLVDRGIPWPRLPSGALDLKDDTFRDLARTYPEVGPLRELRHTLGELRLFNLAVGSDRRNRCLLSAFRSKTGRNQPSNSAFIFGPSRWLRGLIKPEPGRAIAYIDYSQQEFAIAAALSGDPAMIGAYRSGDPYLSFAIQARAAPADATRESHGLIRDQFKSCALGVLYGLGEVSLGQRIGQTSAHARELLRLHREVFPIFWRWSQSAVDCAILHGKLWTVFGWSIHTGSNLNSRSLANFPMQGNGSEILRLACTMLTESGIKTCAPIHDAVVVEADLAEIEHVVERAQEIMEDASRGVLGGFTINTDVKMICYPNRFVDERGQRMWNLINEISDELDRPDNGTLF